MYAYVGKQFPPLKTQPLTACILAFPTRPRQDGIPQPVRQVFGFLPMAVSLPYRMTSIPPIGNPTQPPQT